VALDRKQVMVRLPAEGHAALQLMANAQGRTDGEMAGEILANALLGVAHNAIVAAQQYGRMGNAR